MGFPGPLERFLALFNQGDFWASHEALEDEWRRTRSGFYHGLILYASAWVHWERENRHGVSAQLAKALEALAPYPDSYLGLDLSALRRDARALGAGLAPVPPRLLADASRVRGDEPELAPDD